MFLLKIIRPHLSLCRVVACGNAKSIKYLFSLYCKSLCYNFLTFIFKLNLLDTQRILQQYCHSHHSYN